VSEARVFSPGALTVAADRDGLNVSCGHVDLPFIKSMNLAYDSETKSVKAVVEFYHSHHEETSRQIEEAVRTARALGWVEVRY
jgi:hypothetical protein